jgi:hypothetical protein
MDKKLIRAPFRLAFREEGGVINAYFADNDTMDDAIFMASISKKLCEADREIFQRWREVVGDGFAAFVQATTGTRPIIGEVEAAPEHEKAGHA